MAYYKPCKNCAVDKATCSIRQGVAAAIKGHHVTSINFRCKRRSPMFRLGQRVQFRWRIFEATDYDTDEAICVFAGTVLQEKGLKFIVRVDDAPAVSIDDGDWSIPRAPDIFRNDRLIVKIRPADMWASGEPGRTICPNCCAYYDEPDRCDGSGKPGGWDAYWPDGCLHMHRSRHDREVK